VAGRRIVGGGITHAASRSWPKARRRRCAAFILAVLAIALIRTVGAGGTVAEEVHHDDYRFEDGIVAFFSRVGNVARYREGDEVLFLARESAHTFASRGGATISVLDGGRRLRVEAATGQTRLAERVELYREEEVRFHNGKVRLAGTLLLPLGAGPHPAVVFAEGAGRTTRHGFGRILADHFARQGIAVLVYDKRGAGESTGSYGGIIRDYGALAEDLLAGVRMLQSRPDIDTRRIGVRGTSEGGWVVALAAARSRGIAFVIGVSAPARPGPNGVWEMQNKLRDAGVAEDARDTMVLASTQVIAVVRLLGLLPECCRAESFPEAEWERVRQPVLLLYGELDKQVPPALSARTLSGALRRGGNQNHVVRAFPQANHAIALAERGFESEVRSAVAVRFAPGYLETMVTWIQAQLRRESVPADHGWIPGTVEPLPEVEHPPWHAHPAFQLSLWAVLLAVFSATCAAPLVRRLVRPPPDASEVDPEVRRVRRLAVVVSGAHLAVAAGLIAVLAQFGAGQPLSALWTALRVVALASVLLAVTLVALSARTWSRRWPGRARLRHTAVTVAAVAFVPLLGYWNLLA
jgi:dienelactone hydrolase